LEDFSKGNLISQSYSKEATAAALLQTLLCFLSPRPTQTTHSETGYLAAETTGLYGAKAKAAAGRT